MKSNNIAHYLIAHGTSPLTYTRLKLLLELYGEDINQIDDSQIGIETKKDLGVLKKYVYIEKMPVFDIPWETRQELDTLLEETEDLSEHEIKRKINDRNKIPIDETLESEIEEYLKQKAYERGFLCLKFTSPSTNHVPDRILIGNDKTVFIELKRPGEAPRIAQSHTIDMMRNAGAIVYTVDSKKGIDKIIDSM